MLGSDGIMACVLALIGVRRKSRPIKIAAIGDRPGSNVIAMPPPTPATQPPPKALAPPRDASVVAFIEHAIEGGVIGRHQFAVLWDVYRKTCAHFGLSPISIQTFRLDLNMLGLAKGQLDLRQNGRRYRPTYFVIPTADEFAMRQKIKARLESRALCA